MSKKMVMKLSIALLSSLAVVNAAFNSPGVAPREFIKSENVPLQVDKMTSPKTHIPYDYYELPFCKPQDRNSVASENLGEVLSGDRIETSLYKLEMKIPRSCQILCRKVYTKNELKDIREMIEGQYRINMITDDMPGVMRLEDRASPGTLYFPRGYPVGFKLPKETEHFLFNHVRITILYHENSEEFKGARIVGFELEPFSINHKWDHNEPFDKQKTVLQTCNEMNPVGYQWPTVFEAVDSVDDDVIFTYDVNWVESDTPWAHRWDMYLRGDPYLQGDPKKAELETSPSHP